MYFQQRGDDDCTEAKSFKWWNSGGIWVITIMFSRRKVLTKVIYVVNPSWNGLNNRHIPSKSEPKLRILRIFAQKLSSSYGRTRQVHPILALSLPRPLPLPECSRNCPIATRGSRLGRMGGSPNCQQEDTVPVFIMKAFTSQYLSQLEELFILKDEVDYKDITYIAKSPWFAQP